MFPEKNKLNKTTQNKNLAFNDTNLEIKNNSSKSFKNIIQSNLKSNENYKKLNKSTSKITNLSSKENRIKNKEYSNSIQQQNHESDINNNLHKNKMPLPLTNYDSKSRNIPIK